jgi:hypothetical protein
VTIYKELYDRFAELQVDPVYSPRLLYPVNSMPYLTIKDRLVDCAVGIPGLKEENGVMQYARFKLKDDEFGRYAVSRLVLASTTLLGAKASFMWQYRKPLNTWLASKADQLRANYVSNVIFDAIARKRITDVEGKEFYQDIIATSDMLSASMLPRNPADIATFAQSALTSSVLGVPVGQISSPIAKTVQGFIGTLKTLYAVDTKVGAGSDGLPEIQPRDPKWVMLNTLADALYQIIEKIPGKWHTVYLPYANRLPDPTNQPHMSLYKDIIDESLFDELRKQAKLEIPNFAKDVFTQSLMEMSREKKRTEKALARMSKATGNMNFSTIGFPVNDFLTFNRIQGTLMPQIRRMIEQTKAVKNLLDEDPFHEMGYIDLQPAIQAMASETRRTDVFVKDEELLKNECWAILIDASLSLEGVSDRLKAVAICVAETAKESIGSNPWGMFAFSDEFWCIKDFVEPYDHVTKARIGGLKPGGLSHIPDAIRTCRNLLREHAQERNYIILISDGLPSGYPGIENEFTKAVKESTAQGVLVAAIGLGSSRIRKYIPNSKVVGEPTEMVKAFSKMYQSMSSS